MTGRAKGTTGIETAVLIAGFSVPMILAFMMFSPTTLEECGRFWKLFDDCADPATGGSGSGSASAGYEILPGDFGDEEYDPDPGTTYSGWWVFGNGQAFSFHEEKMVIPDDPDYEHSIDPYYAKNWYVEKVGHVTPLAGYNHESSRGNLWNTYALETRMLQLDSGVDCLNASTSGKYCEVVLSNPGQNQGEDVLVASRAWEVAPYPYSYIWNHTTYETIDYDRFAIDPAGKNVAIKDMLEDTEIKNDPDGNYVSRYEQWTKAEYQFQGDAAVYDIFNRGRPDRVIDAQQNNISVHFDARVELELANGNFETNNYVFDLYGEKNNDYSGFYTYRPAPGGVVAAYPTRDWRHSREDYGHGHFADFYDSDLRERVYFPVHGIEIAGADWTVKECSWSEVPFERATQHSTANYRTARASVGHEGLLGGPSVILENSAGETWELIYVDRPPITLCDESNPLLFRQRG
ncbi:hypothetical protein [Citreimonas salinaria]|uniref:Uncharacterized protein n=1 Tax=Citreimonas salinaria TaxID=321339 RepID=A0A1H3LYZ8_9RHOB|nr:hypothetical protein [Citreimonas salinaria]SDY69556.1 hypothetical protein SAMN05444340_1155 [Citreimonas salinaria]